MQLTSLILDLMQFINKEEFIVGEENRRRNKKDIVELTSGKMRKTIYSRLNIIYMVPDVRT